MMNETQQTMTTAANFDLNATRSIRGTEVGEDSALVPTKKRAKDKEEYERRKQEEEEKKRIMVEEYYRQLEQYGGVEDNMKAIPIEKILEFKMKQK